MRMTMTKEAFWKTVLFWLVLVIVAVVVFVTVR